MALLVSATSPGQMEEIRTLFLEYEKGLGISLCFQNFGEELRTLPGAYAPPSGALLLAMEGAQVAGCCALRTVMREPFERAAELKRLYVRPDFRGRGIARQLVLEIIKEASDKGYRTLLLDTLETMKEAQGLYLALGFEDIPPYYPNPIAGTRYMKYDLTRTGAR